MNEEIAAFESLVEAYLVPDAELSPSGKKLREKICECIRKVDNMRDNHYRDIVVVGDMWEDVHMGSMWKIYSCTNTCVTFAQMGCTHTRPETVTYAKLMEHWRRCDG